jgi:hypothetical protein
MQIVNGYVCQNCTDVENAKKYVDPAHPQQGPKAAEPDPKRTVTAEAVTFGGTLSAPGPSRDQDPARRTLGAQLDASA